MNPIKKPCKVAGREHSRVFTGVSRSFHGRSGFVGRLFFAFFSDFLPTQVKHMNFCSWSQRFEHVWGPTCLSGTRWLKETCFLQKHGTNLAQRERTSKRNSFAGSRLSGNSDFFLALAVYQPEAHEKQCKQLLAVKHTISTKRNIIHLLVNIRIIVCLMFICPKLQPKKLDTFYEITSFILVPNEVAPL